MAENGGNMRNKGKCSAPTRGMSPEERAFGEVLGACERGEIPGAVLLVERSGKRVFLGATGAASLYPERTPVTEETLFDLASLTKPLATAPTAVLILDQAGVALDTPLGAFLPELEGALAWVTPEMLLTHTAGVPAEPDIFKLFPYESGIDRSRALEHLYHLPLEALPGQRVIYSCSGYLLLAHLTEILGGARLGELFRRRILAPLKKREPLFDPPQKMAMRCASTEACL